MTRRLYYDDPYTTEFTARVVERAVVDGRLAVALDQTYFYPTGGGQPHDTGRLGGAPVLEVLTRDSDHVVLHVLDGEVAGDEVVGEVYWPRRLDHMQHHTGQHILTQAFVEVAGANTVGFHLGEESVTIDLDAAEITDQQIAAAEDLANRVVQENRPVRARLIDPGDADQVRMRKMPDYLATDGLRVVEVEDFDRTACGGTHVAHTGEIGLIKVVKAERRGEETRIEFRCGGRALQDYQAKHAAISGLAARLSVGYWEVDEAVGRLEAELKETRQALRAARKALIRGEAIELLAGTAEVGGVRIVRACFPDRDAGEARALVSHLIEGPGAVALVGTAGEKAELIFARSADLSLDVVPLLKEALASLGSDRGGGRPDFAQGGGIWADAAQVDAALAAAASAAQRTIIEAGLNR
jgi:alanyl-tRNA synthetase